MSALLHNWAYVAILALLIGSGAGLYAKGHSDAAALCGAAELRAELGLVRADLQIARQSADDARRQRQSIEAVSNERKGIIDELKAELEKIPDVDVCRATQRDLDWMQRIRNEVRKKPAKSP
jgi:hypothetical protein